MITIGEMQISGMLTMMMLSVMLMACVRNRSTHRTFRQMTGSTPANYQ
jgi:hypothetical protein